MTGSELGLEDSAAAAEVPAVIDAACAPVRALAVSDALAALKERSKLRMIRLSCRVSACVGAVPVRYGPLLALLSCLAAVAEDVALLCS